MPAAKPSDLFMVANHLTRSVARLTPDVLKAVVVANRCSEPVGNDGYRSNGRLSMGGGDSTSNQTIVEQHATGSAMRDPVAVWAAEVDAMLRRAAILVDQAERRCVLMAKSREAGRAEQAPKCIVCSEPAIWPDRPGAKAGRCVRCYGWRARHGSDWFAASIPPTPGA